MKRTSSLKNYKNKKGCQVVYRRGRARVICTLPNSRRLHVTQA